MDGELGMIWEELGEGKLLSEHIVWKISIFI